MNKLKYLLSAFVLLFFASCKDEELAAYIKSLL